MQTRNLECQLAMAQLKRYLSGAKLSNEALEALESHLIECSACQIIVQSERAQQVETPPPTQAVVQTPAPAPTVRKPILGGHLKTLSLSVGLATVLIAMSMIANDPTKLFGERLQSAPKKPTASKPKSSPKPEPKQPPAPVVGSAEAIRGDQALTENPPVDTPTSDIPETKTISAEPKPKPKPMARPRKTAARSQPPRPRPATKVPSSSNSGIKVYDHEGNPL